MNNDNLVALNVNCECGEMLVIDSVSDVICPACGAVHKVTPEEAKTLQIGKSLAEELTEI